MYISLLRPWARGQSYCRWLEKLTMGLVKAGYCHCLHLKCKVQKKTAAICFCRENNDGEWKVRFNAIRISRTFTPHHLRNWT